MEITQEDGMKRSKEKKKEPPQLETRCGEDKIGGGKKMRIPRGKGTVAEICFGGWQILFSRRFFRVLP